MIIDVVGCGDAFGSGGRLQTCFALRADPAAPPRTLVDCGATSLTGMRRSRIDPTQVATVVLTHLHGDHFGGLPFLVLDGQFRRRATDLAVTGPPGTEVRLRQAMEVLFPGSSTVQRRFDVVVYEYEDREPLRVGDLHITPYEVRHDAGAPAYGVRVNAGGAVVAYSGDTEWTDALVDLAHDADLLLLEGYAPRPVRGHLDLGSIAGNRHRLKSRRLLLTHLSPTALALGDELPAPGLDDGMRLEVGDPLTDAQAAQKPNPT